MYAWHWKQVHIIILSFPCIYLRKHNRLEGRTTTFPAFYWVYTQYEMISISFLFLGVKKHVLDVNLNGTFDVSHWDRNVWLYEIPEDSNMVFILSSRINALSLQILFRILCFFTGICVISGMIGIWSLTPVHIFSCLISWIRLCVNHKANIKTLFRYDIQ